MPETGLGIYIHIPFCVRKCEYCDFLSFPADAERREAYVAALCREISGCALLHGRNGRAAALSVFLGGGTPSVLTLEQTRRILAAVRSAFALSPDAEISMECNPGTLTGEKLRGLRDLGVNRLSIGLQSAHARELRLLGRIHSREEFEKNYAAARMAGFSNINVDLMCGLPGQTTEDWRRTLCYVTGLNPPPEHISAYSLIVEEGTPFYERYHAEDLRRSLAGDEDLRRSLAGDEGVPPAAREREGGRAHALPSEEEERRMIHLTRELLEEQGWRQYEISNFAKPGFACVHNIGYWKRRDYIGFGLGAASCVENTRWSNTRDMERYLGAFADVRDTLQEETREDSQTDTREDIQADTREDIQADTRKEIQTDTRKDIQADTREDIREDVTLLTRQERIEETVFLGLRMTEGIDLEAFKKEFGADFRELYGERLTWLEEKGLAEIVDGCFRVTPDGLDLEGYVEERLLT